MDWTHRLRIKQLIVLVTLHETLNLSKAAARMAMTQPAMSKWLRELEGDLGVTLFERHSRGLVPTPYCDVLVERARLVLNELDRTAELLRAMSGGLSGRLHVGATPIVMTDVLPSALASFQDAYPNASVTVTDSTLDLLLPHLKDGRLDFALSRLEDRNYGGDIAQERLYVEQVTVIAGRKHPLAGKKKVGWQDVLAYPWVGPPVTGPLRRDLEQELALANQPLPRIVVETSSVLLMASLLERSDMLAVISRRPAEYFRALGWLDILPLPIQRKTHVGVLWRRNAVLGELESGFLRSLRKAATSRS